MEVKNYLGYFTVSNGKRLWKVEIVGSNYYINFKKKSERTFKSMSEVINYLERL